MVSDLRTFKIPNQISLTGIISGLFLNLVFYGLSGLRMSLIGILCPVLMLYILFLIKAVGAGDIKLLAGIGAFISRKIINVIILAFIIAAIYSLICILLKLIKRAAGKERTPYSFSRMHLSVPIFMSCSVYFIFSMISV